VDVAAPGRGVRRLCLRAPISRPARCSGPVQDDRSTTFCLATLPLPGWHEPLARVWAERTGPSGGLRTLASARGAWYVLGRFMRFLADLTPPPANPTRLTVADVERFIDARKTGPHAGRLLNVIAEGDHRAAIRR
jgi:hypothetical protein